MDTNAFATMAGHDRTLMQLRAKLRKWAGSQASTEVLANGADCVETLETHASLLLAFGPSLHTHPERSEARQRVLRSIERHGGEVDTWCTEGVCGVFRSADSALGAAVDIDRARTGERLKIALGHVTCTLALFPQGGSAGWTVLGPQIAAFEAFARNAPAGTIAIDPAAYALLEEAIGSVPALVSQEFVDSDLQCVNLTVPPGCDAELSTFAGLGLTPAVRA